MKLIWNGHSCFTLETSDGTIVFDPYADNSVPGLPPLALRADMVLSSHAHKDHSGLECVELSGREIRPTISVLHSYHDDALGSRRGKNNIFIVSSEGMRIAHLGDIGCPLTGKQIEELRGVDVLLLPVGGYFTVSAEMAHEMALQICPRITVPMHYRGKSFGHPEIGTLNDYLVLCDNIVHYPANILSVDKKMPIQTAVLTYCAPDKMPQKGSGTAER